MLLNSDLLNGPPSELRRVPYIFRPETVKIYGKIYDLLYVKIY